MSDTPNTPAPNVPTPPKPKVTTVTVQVISLPAEMAMAALGGLIAGLGAFVGALTITTAEDIHAIEAAAIGGGFTAVTFFTNSLRNWYGQRYSTPA